MHFDSYDNGMAMGPIRSVYVSSSGKITKTEERCSGAHLDPASRNGVQWIV